MCLREFVGTQARKTARLPRGKNTARVLHDSCYIVDFGPATSVDSTAICPTVLSMLTLSTRAARQVMTMHSAQGDAQKKLRVFVESGGCSGFEYGMSFDLPKADDRVFESEGVQILVDPTSLAYLDGTAIDFDDGLHGKGFELKNPNAQSTCGCGKSFN